MFQDFLLLIPLILALYGLAHFITNVVLWLTASVKTKPYQVIIRLREGENVQSTVINVRERLSMGGLTQCCHLIAVNQNLPPDIADQARLYCKGEQIPFVDKDDLLKILENTSFQKDENTV